MSSSIDTNKVPASTGEGQQHFVDSMLVPQNYKLMQQQQQKHSQQVYQPHNSSEQKKSEISGQTPVINSNISKYMPPTITPQTDNLVQSNQNCIKQEETINNRIPNGPNQNLITSKEYNMNFMNSSLSSVPSQLHQSQGLGSVTTSAYNYSQNSQQGQERTIDKPVANAQIGANHLIPTATASLASPQLQGAPVTYQAVTNTTSILSNPVVNPSIQNIDKNLRNLNLSSTTNGTATIAVSKPLPMNNMPPYPTQIQRPQNIGNYQAIRSQGPFSSPSTVNIPKYLPTSTENNQPRIGLAPISMHQQVNSVPENYMNNNMQQFPPTNVYPTVEAVKSEPILPLPPQQHNQMPSYSFSQQQQQQLQPQIMAASRPAIMQTQFSPLQYQNQTYPQQQQHLLTSPFQSNAGVMQTGFNRLWGQDTIDLIQNRHILSPATLEVPKIMLHNQFHDTVNCNPNILRCTLTKIPESNSLLQKSRLPLGIVIHPFRDINSLPVIQCPNIVRCRLCRTYINPFVYFVDSKMWKCNLCYRVNELSEDFQFDPATKTYGDVTRRPEVRSSTIEFIASSEYMLRPPQPAIYLFVFDVSIMAQQCGYLENICNTLSNYLDDVPGGPRTQVGFIAFNSHVHFYSMAEGYNQPHEITLLDIEDPFLPRPDNLLVNLKECKELVRDLLKQLPKRFADTHDPGSALGSALSVAYKLMQSTGGRVTVFQTCLPNKGPGSLLPRENPNDRSGKDVAHLNPATDYYKRYALECSGYQIAVDLFLLNQQFSDLATISGISKHSGGCIHHFPLYQKTKQHMVDSLTNCFKRYLVRKIGFEAVMRVRCTRGLQVHTFHGNFFVRSTDLLSLPNVNPDAGYGMQISYEESLSDVRSVCFQAALLYTNSEGERRIRVHTLCLPITSSLPEIMHSADTEAIVSLLSKMAVDRSLNSSVNDAREAFSNATVDIFNAFKLAQNMPTGQTGQLIAPRSLALLPLYILALLKHPAFRVGSCTRLDDRLFAMDCMKTLPLDHLMKTIYPEFYNIDALFYKKAVTVPHGYTDPRNNYKTNNPDDEDEDDDEEDELPELTRLQLSAEVLDSQSVYLMDCGPLIMIYVGINVPIHILQKAFDINSTAELQDYVYGLPNIPNSVENNRLERFIMKLNDEKPYVPTIQIIRDTSTAKPQFMERLVDDRSESSLSYYEFLQHIQAQVK